MGSSKSSQATTMQDNRRVLGEGSISAENSTVNVLDNGAISRSFDFGENAMNSVREIVSGALNFGLKSQSDSAGLMKDAYADAKGRGAMTDYLLIGAIAMAGIVAFAAVKK